MAGPAMADQEFARLAKVLEKFNAIAEEEARRQESSINGTDDDDNETVVTTPSGEEGEEEAKVPCVPTRVSSEPVARQHRRNTLLVEQLKKVTAAFRPIKDKLREDKSPERAAIKAIKDAMQRCLQHSLFSFASPAYEPLAREACALTTAYVRALGYHGGVWAPVIVPGMLERLETDSTACASDVFACLCAIMSHNYHTDGVLLPMVLSVMQSTDMDPLVRRQCYGLIKIAIEKWPPNCFKGVDDLCQRLVLDVSCDVEEFVVCAMASLLVVCRKWPDVGLTTVKTLPRAKQVRLFKEYPQLHSMLSPRRARRKSFPSQGPPSPTRLEPASAHTPGFGGSLSGDRKKKRRQSSMFLPAHPSSAGLDPLRANTTTLHRTGTSDAPKAVKGQDSGNGRLQQFIKWKLAKDGGLADALAQQQSSGLDSLDVSEDGSTTSSLRSEGNANSSRGTPQGGVGAEELRRRKLTMLSPTLRQCLANTHSDNHNTSGPRGSLSLRQSPITPDSAGLALYSDPPSAASSAASSPGRPLQPRLHPSATTSGGGSGSRIAAAFQHRHRQHNPLQPQHNNTNTNNTGVSSLPVAMEGMSNVPPGPLPAGSGSGRPSFYLSSEDVSRDPSRNPSREASPPPCEDRENRGNRFGNTSAPSTDAGLGEGKDGKKAAQPSEAEQPVTEQEEEGEEEGEGMLEEGVVSGGLDAEEEEELARLLQGEEELEGRVLFEELCVEEEGRGAPSCVIGPIEEEDEHDLHSSGQPSPLHPLIAPVLAPPSPGHFSKQGMDPPSPSSTGRGKGWGLCYALLVLAVVLLLTVAGLLASPHTAPHMHHLATQGRDRLNGLVEQLQSAKASMGKGTGTTTQGEKKEILTTPLPTQTQNKPADKKADKKADRKVEKKSKAKGGEGVAIADVQPLTPPPKASPKTAPKPSEVKKAPVEAPEVNAQGPSTDKDKAKAPAAPKKENLALFSWRTPLSQPLAPVVEEVAVSVIAPAPTSRHGRKQHHKAKDAAGQALLPGSEREVGPYMGTEGGKRRLLPPWRKAVKKNLLDPLGRLLKDGLLRAWQALGLITVAVLVTLALV